MLNAESAKHPYGKFLKIGWVSIVQERVEKLLRNFL